MRLSSIAAGVLGVVTIGAACVPDSSTTEPRLGEACSLSRWLGEFNGRATGAASDSLAGCAYYTTLPDFDGIPVFGLVLTHGHFESPNIKMKILIWGGWRSTSVVGDSLGQMKGTVLIAAEERLFEITSGTLNMRNLVTPNNEVVRMGSVNLVATDARTGETITIVGGFLSAAISSESAPGS